MMTAPPPCHHGHGHSPLLEDKMSSGSVEMSLDGSLRISSASTSTDTTAAVTVVDVDEYEEEQEKERIREESSKRNLCETKSVKEDDSINHQRVDEKKEETTLVSSSSHHSTSSNCTAVSRNSNGVKRRGLSGKRGLRNRAPPTPTAVKTGEAASEAPAVAVKTGEPGVLASSATSASAEETPTLLAGLVEKTSMEPAAAQSPEPVTVQQPEPTKPPPPPAAISVRSGEPGALVAAPPAGLKKPPPNSSPAVLAESVAQGWAAMAPAATAAGLKQPPPNTASPILLAEPVITATVQAVPAAGLKKPPPQSTPADPSSPTTTSQRTSLDLATALAAPANLHPMTSSLNDLDAERKISPTATAQSIACRRSPSNSPRRFPLKSSLSKKSLSPVGDRGNSPRFPSVSFAALPPGKALVPDLDKDNHHDSDDDDDSEADLASGPPTASNSRQRHTRTRRQPQHIPHGNSNNDDDDEMDKKPAAKPTPKPTTNIPRPRSISPTQGRSSSAPSEVSTPSPIPTPRGRGLRARRNAQDRTARRQQIRERAFDSGSGEMTTGTGNSRASSPMRPPQQQRSSGNSRSPSHSPMNLSMTGKVITALEPGAMMACRVNHNHASLNNSNSSIGSASVMSSAAARTPQPGDSLLGTPRSAGAAPGDNMHMTTRPATRSRVIRPLAGSNNSEKQQLANPTADAYENTAGGVPRAASMPSNSNDNSSSNNNDGSGDHSIKQRLRRENQDTMPSAIRPGAYKEIPGRGLVRNDTLRFSIMNTIQKQKRSLRRLLTGGGLGPSTSSSNSASASPPTNNSGPSRRSLFASASGEAYRATREQQQHQRNTADTNNNMRKVNEAEFMSEEEQLAFLMAMGNSMHSIKSIPSVLVDDETLNDSKSYLGNISMRSINSAGGLSVARPVYQREASTLLEALCIIPGDLAVAEALDAEQLLKQVEKGHSQDRLEELTSGSRPKLQKGQPHLGASQRNKRHHHHHGHGNKARRIVGSIAKTPKKILKKAQQTTTSSIMKIMRKTRRTSKEARGGGDNSSSHGCEGGSEAFHITSNNNRTKSTAKLKMDASGASGAVRRKSW